MSPTERAQSNIGDVVDKIAETLAQSVERVRFLLLAPFSCRWNGWVRDWTASLEVRR